LYFLETDHAIAIHFMCNALYFTSCVFSFTNWCQYWKWNEILRSV